jgi:hypothetical protein
MNRAVFEKGNIGLVICVLFAVAITVILYGWSANGRFVAVPNGGIMDTRTGVLYAAHRRDDVEPGRIIKSQNPKISHQAPPPP